MKRISYVLMGNKKVIIVALWCVLVVPLGCSGPYGISNKEVEGAGGYFEEGDRVTVITDEGTIYKLRVITITDSYLVGTEQGVKTIKVPRSRIESIARTSESKTGAVLGGAIVLLIGLLLLGSSL